MHVVTLSEPMVLAGAAVEAGVPYLMNDTGAGSLLSSRQLVRCADGLHRPRYRLVTVSPMPEMKLDPKADYNGRTIWLFRGGGFGDIMLLTPTVREIKRRWPESRVTVVTMPEYAPVLLGLDCTVRLGFVPFAEIGAADAVVFFEGVIEDNPDARTAHAVDLFAHHAGLTDTEFSSEEMRLHFELIPQERDWARRSFQRNGHRRVGIQAMPSAAARTYPPELIVRVIQELVRRDFEVFIFGKPDQVECDMKGVVNLTNVVGETGKGMTFRQSAAVAETCDVMLVPDSSMLHVAGALGIPAVALFASFDASLRMIPGAPVRVIQAKADCAPCHWHESGEAGQFPPGGPCQIAKFCTVLASITPERIVEEIELAFTEFSETSSVQAGDSDEPIVVYDFLNNRIGDTVAAIFLLTFWLEVNPRGRLFLYDRGALPVEKYFPLLPARVVYFNDFNEIERPANWEELRRLNFEFGNLWISAPSAFRDGWRMLPPRREMEPPLFDVGIHCLTDAAYNVKRNHDLGQFELLRDTLRERGLNVYWVEIPPDIQPLEDVVAAMRRCNVWIGGDTGLSHLFAANHPDRPLVAIYSDDINDRTAFEPERRKMRPFWRERIPGEIDGMSSSWCSDPLTDNLHKFVMPGETHQFDFDAVLASVLNLTGKGGHE